MALDIVRVTDALSPVSSVFGYEEVRYMPSVLLDTSSLPAALVHHPAFACACRVGYDDYFERLYIEGEEDNELCMYRPCESAVVLTVVHENVLSFLAPPVTGSPRASIASISSDVGFVLGWLSALARFQPTEAVAGLQVLSSLVTFIHRYHFTRPVSHGLPRRVVGSDGFPLDM